MRQNSIHLSFLHFSHIIELDGELTWPKEIVILTKFGGFASKPLLSAINFGEKIRSVTRDKRFKRRKLHNKWILEACLIYSILKQNICGRSSKSLL